MFFIGCLPRRFGIEYRECDLSHKIGQPEQKCIFRINVTYAWAVMEDMKDPARYIEYYRVESCLEYLRRHERVTNDEKHTPGKDQKIIGG